MKLLSLWAGICLCAISIASCATLPSHQSLLSGINNPYVYGAYNPSARSGRSAYDPVCQDFYRNVARAYQLRQRNLRNNGRLASLGVTLASAAVGLGGFAQIATQSVSGIAISRFQNQRYAPLSPNNPFGGRVRGAAAAIGCPIGNI